MDRKELQKQYQLRQLEDPTVGEWEKKKIRRRYNILTLLAPGFFDKTFEDADYNRLKEYIEERISKIKQQQPNYKPPDKLQSIVALWGFLSIFESDGFWDYADKSISKNKDLWEEREGLITALNIIGLTEDAHTIERVWRNEYKNRKRLEEFQEKYWSTGFKSDFNNRMFELIRKSEDEILNLDKILGK